MVITHRALVFNGMAKEPALQWGARAMSEQRGDENKMVSHTSRYASILALLAEKTGNITLGAIARRSWDWSSYLLRSTFLLPEVSLSCSLVVSMIFIDI